MLEVQNQLVTGLCSMEDYQRESVSASFSELLLSLSKACIYKIPIMLGAFSVSLCGYIYKWTWEVLKSKTSLGQYDHILTNYICNNSVFK
jgi:hypothetical protein